MRELEAWAGRGQGNRESGGLPAPAPQALEGQPGGGRGGAAGRAGIELLVNWADLAVSQQHSSGARPVPCRCEQIAPDATMHATWTFFSSFSGCDDVNILSCVSKKRKKATTPGRASFWWSAHNRNRDFLLRIQNRSLVRPELIRSKDGVIDGDGGSAGTVESAGHGVLPS